MTLEELEIHAKTLAASWKLQLEGGEDLTTNLVNSLRGAYERGYEACRYEAVRVAQAARLGEIDKDLRCVRSYIEGLAPEKPFTIIGP